MNFLALDLFDLNAEDFDQENNEDVEVENLPEGAFIQPFFGNNFLIQSFVQSHNPNNIDLQTVQLGGGRTRATASPVSFFFPFGFARPMENRGNRGNFLPYNTNANVSAGVNRLALFFRLLVYSPLFEGDTRNNFFSIGIKLVNLPLHEVFESARLNFSDLSRIDHPAIFVDAGNRTRSVQTPGIQRGNQSKELFVRRLFERFTDIYNQHVNSEVVDNQNLEVPLNIFLIMNDIGSGRFAPSGGGSYINDLRILNFLKNNKGVFIPPSSFSNNCFWMCYAHQLSQKNTFRTLSVNQLADLLFSGFSTHFTTNAGHGQVLTTKEVPLSFIPFIEDAFTMEVIVLDIHGDVLYGTMENIYEKTFETNNCLKLCLVEDHYILIKSYLSFIPFNQCYRCNHRFQSKQRLKYHLENNVCLTCDCLKVCVDGRKRRYTTKNTTSERFTSESEWRHHVNNLQTQCPLQSDEARLRRREDVREINERQRIRFQKPKERTLCDSDKREVIFFDLESVVPFNESSQESSLYLPQIPYAAGWITSKEMRNGEDVHIAYGLDCIGDFFKFLQDMYIRKFEETRVVIHASFMNEMSTSEGRTKLMAKLKRTWRRKVSRRATANLNCYTCGQGDMLNYTLHESCIIKSCVEGHARKEVSNPNSEVCPRVVIYAHNGGKYDWLFVHRYLMENGMLEHLTTLRSNNRYINMVYKRLFFFRDTMNFLAGSLDKLGKDFNVATLKGNFPYDLISSPDTIYEVISGEEEIRSMIPPSMFKVSDSHGGAGGMTFKREFTSEEYESFFDERGWSYDIQKETIKYLVDDVKCLAQVVLDFAGGFSALDHPMDFYDYDTIGQMSHYYFQQFYLEDLVYPSLSLPETRWIRKSIYGGRTEVFVRHLMDGAIENSENKNIYYYDVNSLYPYIMESKFLPGGDPEWFFPENTETYREMYSELTFQPHLHNMTSQIKYDIVCKLCECSEEVYGFLDVEIVPPQDLLYPVLPERRNVGSTFKNFFCLRNKRGVYYSEELKLAIRHGYVVTEVFGYSQWQRTECYRDFIKDLKRLKMRGEGRNADGVLDPTIEKNKSLRQASKLMQNSSFGKTIQRFNDKKIDIVDSPMELWRLCKKAEELSIHPLFSTRGGEVVEVTVKLPEGVNHKSCPAVGSAILAEARMELYSYFEWCEANDSPVLYCDTDSIVFCGSQPLPAEMTDDVQYGKMKLEIPTEDIVPNGFVAVSPKCYAFKLKDETPYIKCKGVSMGNNILSSDSFQKQMREIQLQEDINNLLGQTTSKRSSFQGVNFDTLLSMARGEVHSCYSNQMIFLKNKCRDIIRLQSTKMLCDTFDKRKMCLNGNTFPWSNCNQSNFLVDGDITMCSNFLSFASPQEIGGWIKECGGLEGELFTKMLPTYCDWLEDTDTEAKREKIVKVYDIIADT